MIGERFYLPFLSNGFPCPCPPGVVGLFVSRKRLVVEFFLRLTVGRLLHQWFPSWVKPFVFDLVLDTDLSYSQVLSLSQGWINKVKRSMPDHG